MQRSLETRDRAKAVAKIEAKEAEMWLERTQEKKETPPNSAEQCIADFIAHKRHRGTKKSTLDQQGWMFARALKDMGCKTPAEATAAKVQRWADSYSNITTRQVNFFALRGFFRWLLKEGRIPSNPCESIEMGRKKVKPVRRRFLTPEMAETVLSTPCGEDLKFALFCMLHAGLRYGEVCAARPEWFDLRTGLLHVTREAGWSTKDSDDRTIPLTARFREFLAGYGLRSPWMLRPESKPGKSLYRVNMLKTYHKHMRACGARCTYHDLRRTFASLHVSAGTPIYVVAKWLGDSIKVTEEHYAHLHHAGDDIERAWRV